MKTHILNFAIRQNGQYPSDRRVDDLERQSELRDERRGDSIPPFPGASKMATAQEDGTLKYHCIFSFSESLQKLKT
jgi:hypothetical protein